MEKEEEDQHTALTKLKP